MTSLSSTKVIAVIPAFNEGKTVGNVVRGLVPYVSEIIVVDDHSSDNTSDEARKSGAIVLRHEMNGGYDASINDGFKEAATRGAQIIFTFDADGEHDAADVPRLLEPIFSDTADIVLGQRPNTTHFAEKIFAFYTDSRYGIKDPLCGFKAYRRTVYDAVGFFDSVGSIGTELTLRGLRKSFRLSLIPITLHTRVNDTSRFYKRRFWANLKIFKAMFRVLTV